MLVTFLDLKTLYGMPFLTESSKSQYENLLATAEEECLDYAGLELSGTATEYFDGNGQTKFILLRKPVKEITSVYVGGESTTAYRYDERHREIILESPAYSEVKVEESLGFSGDTPRIIKQAIATTVQYWGKYLNNNMVGVTSRSNDIGSETLEQYEIPLVVKSSLEKFKNVVV